jgi:tyrosyl-tRNA synthetase
VGRELQRHYNQPSQIVLTMPLLEGTDGVQKMSKSYGNYIGITESPEEMFGKVMSISDALMWRYYELLTDLTVPQIEDLQKKVATSEAHPMKVKQDLGRILVKDFHSAEAAERAAENWSKQFQKKEVPDELEEVKISAAEIGLDGGGAQVRLDRLLHKAGLAESATDASRKIKANAVKVDGEGASSPHIAVNGLPASWVIRVGKRMKRVTVS